MIQGKSVLAIIPARQGSKRCPDKNITLYKNKQTGEMLPLILWAINQARASKYIDHTVVSSDSQAILNWATPPVIALRRPDYLSSEHTKSEAVIINVLYSLPFTSDQYSTHLPDLFVLLQPTSPNRLPSDIDSTIELALTHGSCFTVSPANLLNGAAYASSSQRFLSSLQLTGSQRFTMPHERSLDIDFPEDFSL